MKKTKIYDIQHYNHIHKQYVLIDTFNERNLSFFDSSFNLIYADTAYNIASHDQKKKESAEKRSNTLPSPEEYAELQITYFMFKDAQFFESYAVFFWDTVINYDFKQEAERSKHLGYNAFFYDLVNKTVTKKVRFEIADEMLKSSLNGSFRMYLLYYEPQDKFFYIISDKDSGRRLFECDGNGKIISEIKTDFPLYFPYLRFVYKDKVYFVNRDYIMSIDGDSRVDIILLDGIPPNDYFRGYFDYDRELIVMDNAGYDRRYYTSEPPQNSFEITLDGKVTVLPLMEGRFEKIIAYLANKEAAENKAAAKAAAEKEKQRKRLKQTEKIDDFTTLSLDEYIRILGNGNETLETIINSYPATFAHFVKQSGIAEEDVRKYYPAFDMSALIKALAEKHMRTGYGGIPDSIPDSNIKRIADDENWERIKWRWAKFPKIKNGVSKFYSDEKKGVLYCYCYGSSRVLVLDLKTGEKLGAIRGVSNLNQFVLDKERGLIICKSTAGDFALFHNSNFDEPAWRFKLKKIHNTDWNCSLYNGKLYGEATSNNGTKYYIIDLETRDIKFCDESDFKKELNELENVCDDASSEPIKIPNEYKEIQNISCYYENGKFKFVGTWDYVMLIPNELEGKITESSDEEMRPQGAEDSESYIRENGLTKFALENYSDEEIIHGGYFWALDSIDEKSAKAGRPIDEYTDEENILYSIGWLKAEIDNGGFEQYMSNGDDKEFDLLIKALTLIGAKKTVSTIKKGVKLQQSFDTKEDKSDKDYETFSDKISTLEGELNIEDYISIAVQYLKNK